MNKKLHNNRGLQLLLGLLIGFCFGFLLQRSGVTRYGVILGQLLLYDWTVLKVMLSAVVVGMVGIEGMRRVGWVELHKKPGAVGSTVIGGLIFGAGFAVLGYCPGTMAGAVGQGSLDALIGGMTGMIAGSAFYAAIYPKLKERILNKGSFGDITLPDLVNVQRGTVVGFVAVMLLLVLYLLERFAS